MTNNSMRSGWFSPLSPLACFIINFTTHNSQILRLKDVSTDDIQRPSLCVCSFATGVSAHTRPQKQPRIMEHPFYRARLFSLIWSPSKYRRRRRRQMNIQELIMPLAMHHPVGQVHGPSNLSLKSFYTLVLANPTRWAKEESISSQCPLLVGLSRVSSCSKPTDCISGPEPRTRRGDASLTQKGTLRCVIGSRYEPITNCSFMERIACRIHTWPIISWFAVERPRACMSQPRIPIQSLLNPKMG